MSAVAVLLTDGRLHLQHGPIDCLCQAWGPADEVQLAYRQAATFFASVLDDLCAELPLLRAPLPACRPDGAIAASMQAAGARANGDIAASMHNAWARANGDVTASMYDACARPHGAIAAAMHDACLPFAHTFITPMAAVAGAVADAVLGAMRQGRCLSRAFVNNGGDIAFHLHPGATLRCGLISDLTTPDGLDGTFLLQAGHPARGIATSGRACKGQGGRSFSFGIADSVSVLARTAAQADAAATIIGNAVDLPGHPQIVRRPASEIDPASDLGDRLITFDVGPLSESAVDAALDNGNQTARLLLNTGLITGAVLALRGRFRVLHAPLQIEPLGIRPLGIKEVA